MSRDKQALAKRSDPSAHIYDKLEHSSLNRKAELIHFSVYDRAILNSKSTPETSRLLVIDEEGFKTIPECLFCSKVRPKRRASLKGNLQTDFFNKKSKAFSNLFLHNIQKTHYEIHLIDQKPSWNPRNVTYRNRVHS
jgi:hypothetical protein